jgi:LysM repeat protein
MTDAAVNGAAAVSNIPPVSPPVSPPEAGTATSSTGDSVRFDPPEVMIERGWNEARAEVEAGKPRQALFVLSRLYADPRLTAADRRRLQDALDPLAGQVIYSQQHSLEPAFVVRRGDTLPAIAEQYRVPWQLLANINGVRDPEFLVPGTKLKVVRGPFRAEVHLVDQELTLYLNQLYAGRFPVAIGQDPAPTVGEFEIKGKSEGREFATADGQVIPAAHPANPYGTMFMEIGRNLALHGSATAEDAASNAGCISLSPRDALDVAGILSIGSTVTIRR